MSVRVVVVDDQELMRRGLVMLLGTEDDMEIVGEATNGREALAVVATSAPDVVLTDARMSIMDGVSLIEEVSRAYSSIPVVMLTTFDDGDLVRRAIAAGAAGFMLKDSSTEDLVHAIRSVLEGGLVVDPRVARAALGGAPVPTGPDALAVLTGRAGGGGGGCGGGDEC